MKFTFLLAFVVVGMVACVKEDLSITDPKDPNESLEVDKKRKWVGWHCTNQGPVYYLNHYIANIPPADECRYLHIIDLDNDNEVIGTWAIYGGTTYTQIGLPGRSNCYITPNFGCSLLSSGESYYYQVTYNSTWDDDVYNDPILEGDISPMAEECDC